MLATSSRLADSDELEDQLVLSVAPRTFRACPAKRTRPPKCSESAPRSPQGPSARRSEASGSRGVRRARRTSGPRAWPAAASRSRRGAACSWRCLATMRDVGSGHRRRIRATARDLGRGRRQGRRRSGTARAAVAARLRQPRSNCSSWAAACSHCAVSCVSTLPRWRSPSALRRRARRRATAPDPPAAAAALPWSVRRARSAARSSPPAAAAS
jgi:hypothetical protein